MTMRKRKKNGQARTHAEAVALAQNAMSETHRYHPLRRSTVERTTLDPMAEIGLEPEPVLPMPPIRATTTRHVDPLVLRDDEEVPTHEEIPMNTAQAPSDPAAAPPPETSQPAASVITFGKTYQGVPLPQIEELATRYTEVPLKIQRRNQKGQLATLMQGHFQVPTMTLTEIETWLPQRYGGGLYRIEVKDPQYASRIIFVFEILIEGLPAQMAPSPVSPNSPAVPGAIGQPFNPFAAAAPALPAGSAPPASAWAQGLHPQERAAFYGQPWGSAPATTFASDQLAVQHADRIQAELDKLKTEFAMKEAARELELKQLRTAEAKSREDAKEALHRAELKALEAKIDAQLAHAQQPKGPDWLSVLPALVPMGVAWLSAQSDSKKAELQYQQAGFQAMIGAAQHRPKEDGLKETLGVLMPLIQPMLAARNEKSDPTAQTAMFQAMVEQQLSTIGMVQQVLEANAPPPESPVGAIVKTALEGLQKIGMAYAMGKGLPGQLPADPRPAGVLRAPVQTTYTTEDESGNEVQGEIVEEKAPAGAPAAPAPELEALFGMLPGDFQTFEWRTILTQLHTEPPPPAQDVAGLLAGQIEHLINFKAIPAALATITTAPRPTLEVIFERLPVAQKRPQYAMEVLDLTLRFLMDDNYIPRAQVREAQAQPPAKSPPSDDEDDEEPASATG